MPRFQIRIDSDTRKASWPCWLPSWRFRIFVAEFVRVFVGCNASRPSMTWLLQRISSLHRSGVLPAAGVAIVKAVLIFLALARPSTECVLDEVTTGKERAEVDVAHFSKAGCRMIWKIIDTRCMYSYLLVGMNWKRAEHNTVPKSLNLSLEPWDSLKNMTETFFCRSLRRWTWRFLSSGRMFQTSMGYQMNPGTAFISHTKSLREECRFSTFKILIDIFLGRSLVQRGNNVWRHRTCRIPPRWLLKAARCSPDGWRDLWVFNGIFEHVISGDNLNQFQLFHLYPFVICSDCGLWLFPCFHFESNYPSVHRKFWRYSMTCKKVRCSDFEILVEWNAVSVRTFGASALVPVVKV